MARRNAASRRSATAPAGARTKLAISAAMGLQSPGWEVKSRRSAALAQLVRALDCGSRGPPFKPGRRYHSRSLHHHALSQLPCHPIIDQDAIVIRNHREPVAALGKGL